MNLRKEIDSLCDYLRGEPEYSDFNSCMARNNSVAAQRNLEEMLERFPHNFLLKLNYGYILIKTGYPERARDIFREIILNPSCPWDIEYLAISNYMMACDYLGISNNARLDIRKYYPGSQGDCIQLSDSEKIIIGYITSDAFNHPVGRALAKVIENHDRDKFEINVFYSGETLDNIAQNILQNCDRMIYIGSNGQSGAMSSRDLYYKLREIHIEILIDCNGHTVGGARLPLFCKRPCLCNVTMFGYPNSTLLECFDMRISSEMVTGDRCRWYEPIYNNPYGYMPYFKSYDCKSAEFNCNEMIVIGCISPIAKISKSDIQYYDQLLQANERFQLVYARLGTQYSNDKAQWIMNQHSDNVKNRIVILNLKNQPYLKVFEICDVVLDHVNWSNQTLFQDATSCGVPFILSPKPGLLSSAMLSRDFAFQTGIKCNIEDYEHLDYYGANAFAIMDGFDNSKQWTHAFEEAMIDLYERRLGEL